MANTTKHPGSYPQTKGRGETRHSHFEYGSTQGRWADRDDTDFVITSVNVPDRLDTQEVRNRAEAESALPKVGRFHREDILRAARWAVAVLVLALLGWWGYRIVMPLRAATSPNGVASILSSALGVPVSVGDTSVQLTPSPRLTIRSVFVQGGYRLPEVSLLVNWSDAFRGLQTARWVFGEARVAPMEVNGDEAIALLGSVRAAGRLPAALTTLRFESIRFNDVAVLQGSYEAVLRRSTGQDVSTVSLRRVDAEGRIELEITPAAVTGANNRFALFASKWPASVGPQIVWDEATAQGEFRADRLLVESFSVGARFGNVNGNASLLKSGADWRLAGTARSVDLNVGELIRFAAGLNDADGAESRLPLRGVGKVELVLAGTGASAAEALQRATATGSGAMPGATFGGLNLGLAASQGSAASAGGQTRLTDFAFDVQLSRGGLMARNLDGRAGSLRLTGGFSVDAALKLNGLLRPEVVSPRGTSSAAIQVGGTLGAPSFR
jgi:hypothetical protein